MVRLPGIFLLVNRISGWIIQHCRYPANPYCLRLPTKTLEGRALKWLPMVASKKDVDTHQGGFFHRSTFYILPKTCIISTILPSLIFWPRMNFDKGQFLTRSKFGYPASNQLKDMATSNFRPRQVPIIKSGGGYIIRKSSKTFIKHTCQE